MRKRFNKRWLTGERNRHAGNNTIRAAIRWLDEWFFFFVLSFSLKIKKHTHVHAVITFLKKCFFCRQLMWILHVCGLLSSPADSVPHVGCGHSYLSPLAQRDTHANTHAYNSIESILIKMIMLKGIFSVWACGAWTLSKENALNISINVHSLYLWPLIKSAQVRLQHFQAAGKVTLSLPLSVSFAHLQDIEAWRSLFSNGHTRVFTQVLHLLASATICGANCASLLSSRSRFLSVNIRTC